MDIDLAQVDWFYVVVLALVVFVASLIGNALSFGHRVVASVLTAIVFGGIFVALTYYPHHLPLPTGPAGQKTAAPAPAPAPAAPAAPQRPRNPITDITPPAQQTPPAAPAPAPAR